MNNIYRSSSYGTVNSECCAKNLINRDGLLSTEWCILNSSLPQSAVIAPNFTFQSRTAQGKNRFLSSVQVLAIQPTSEAVALAVGATLTFSSVYIGAGSSSDSEIATVAINGTTATITAVAAGTATITLTDGKNTVAVITVTVA
jgi:uncharacterized protein YjdB